jgi:hypothetical protein
MPHITLNSAGPGIGGLLRYRPETGRPLSDLAEVLLRGPGTLTRGQRELIRGMSGLVSHDATWGRRKAIVGDTYKALRTIGRSHRVGDNRAACRRSFRWRCIAFLAGLLSG